MELYASNRPSKTHQAAPYPEIPRVAQREVRHALKRMTNGKTSRPDDISVETRKAGETSSKIVLIHDK